LRPSPVNLPVIAFLAACLVSWVVGYGIWDWMVQVNKNIFVVQVGQFAIYALSLAAMLLAYQQNLKDPSQPDFLSEALFYKVDRYYIPYRCLYSKNIKNLFMAGRCFSTSHVGLGGPRVMNTTGQMGVAVGYAASLCKKYNTSPRGIYEKHIGELKNLIETGNP